MDAELRPCSSNFFRPFRWRTKLRPLGVVEVGLVRGEAHIRSVVDDVTTALVGRGQGRRPAPIGRHRLGLLVRFSLKTMPVRHFHDLAERRTEVISQLPPGRLPPRTSPGGGRRDRRSVAECLGQYPDQRRKLDEVDRSRCHADTVSPVAQDHLALLRVPRDPKGRTLTSGVRNVETVRERTHEMSMYPPGPAVERSSFLSALAHNRPLYGRHPTIVASASRAAG